MVPTNPEVSSVCDSDRIIGLLDSKSLKAENGETMEKNLLLTRYESARAERGDMLKVDDVLEILSIPLLGIIPESMDVLRASNVGSPLTLADGRSAPAIAYFRAARRLNGEALPVVIRGDKRGLFEDLRKESCMNLLRLFFLSNPEPQPPSGFRSCSRRTALLPAIPSWSQSSAMKSSARFQITWKLMPTRLV